MLYGDDDTMFIVPNVVRLLRRFDHTIPYAITDNLWYRGTGMSLRAPTHPHRDAPRCLACTAGHAAGGLPAGEASGYLPPRACGQDGCTIAAACGPACGIGDGAGGDVGAGRALGKDAWRQLARAHGGAGIIFSRALLEQVGLQRMQECLDGLWDVTGSDTLLSVCLARLGHAFTDPGAWAAHGYNQQYVMFDNNHFPILRLGVEMIAGGRCDHACQWAFENVVSTHVAARQFERPEHAGGAMLAMLHNWQLGNELIAHAAQQRADRKQPLG